MISYSIQLWHKQILDKMGKEMKNDLKKIRSNRSKIRRSRANARERNRMHDLNAAMDILRKHIPVQNIKGDIQAAPQKLSKIETIRLACNYISVMSQTLNEGKSMDIERYLHALSKDLSQATVNLLMSSMHQTSPNSTPILTNAATPYSDFYNNYWWNQEYERYANWKNYHDTYQFNLNHINNNYTNSISEFNYNYL